MVPFLGALDATCPITLIPLDELELAVAFRSNPIHPYECRTLVKWLNMRRRDPMTNFYVRWPYSGLEIVGPIDGWCRNPAQAAEILRDELKGKQSLLIRETTCDDVRAGQLAFLRCTRFWMYTICIILSAGVQLMAKCPIILDVCGVVNFATMLVGSHYASTGPYNKRAGIQMLALAGFAKASNPSMICPPDVVQSDSCICQATLCF